MLLVELAHHGNLRDFLKERHVTHEPAQYINVLPGTRRVCFMPCIRTVQLLRFSMDVAHALDYMASLRVSIKVMLRTELCPFSSSHRFPVSIYPPRSCIATSLRETSWWPMRRTRTTSSPRWLISG